MKVNCLNCNKEFDTRLSWIKKGGGKYCSRHCFGVINTREGNNFTRYKGKFHPMWKGGRRTTTQGYIEIYNPSHPSATIRGCILEHRLVMEKKIGRYLTKKEAVHHVNKIKTDNRIENLHLYTHSSHMSHHSHLRVGRKWTDTQRMKTINAINKYWQSLEGIEKRKQIKRKSTLRSRFMRRDSNGKFIGL